MSVGRDDSIPALPPAVARDVASEARIAAEVERFRSGKHPDDQPPSAVVRPLMVLDMIQSATDGATQATNSGGKFRQLVGEQVDRIEQGSNAGTTWFRPLALRSCSNASLARSAFKYDPAIGWQARGSNTDAMSDEVHVFSALAPPTFVPTPLLREAAPAEAVVVRLLWEAHCVDEAADMETAEAVQAEEMRTLQALLRELVAENPAAFAAIGENPKTTK